MFKAIVMEIKEKYIIVMKEGGELARINKKGDLKVGDSIFCLDEDIYTGDTATRKTPLKNWLIPLGVVAALMIILINPMLNMFSPNVNNTYAVLTFDINPSIQFDLDETGKIIDVKGVNDDGRMLNIEGIQGVTVEQGTVMLRDVLTSENYLGNGNSVLVGFSFTGGDNLVYEENIEKIVKDTFTNTNVAFIKGNEESITKANEQGISLGKYEAIAKLDEDGIEEAFENLSTQELISLLKANNSNLFLNEEALDELQDEIEDRLEEDDDELEEAEDIEDEKEELDDDNEIDDLNDDIEDIEDLNDDND